MTAIAIIPLNYSIKTSHLLIGPMNGLSPNGFQVSVSPCPIHHSKAMGIKTTVQMGCQRKSPLPPALHLSLPPPRSSPALSLTTALLSAQVHELCSLPGPHHAHGPRGGQRLPGFLLLCPGGIPSCLHYHPYHRPGWSPLSLGCIKYGGGSSLSSFGFYP